MIDLILAGVVRKKFFFGTIVQHAWTFMAILIVMEVFLVLITAGIGVIKSILQIASESLGSFIRS